VHALYSWIASHATYLPTLLLLLLLQGVPTTRAGSLVVSGSDSVVRDVHYSGNPRHEPCAVISRIAPSFIR
jgi:uncharacterized protein YdiU (UPF0061 family)